MSQMPSFLKIGNKPNVGRAEGEPCRMQDYKPLLGLWLIDLSLTRRWVEKPPFGSLGSTFCENDFIEITGLHEMIPILDDDISFDPTIIANYGIGFNNDKRINSYIFSNLSRRVNRSHRMDLIGSFF